MIYEEICNAAVANVLCPIKYCAAEVGEWCKTPSGKKCEDLHKRRLGKYVRKIYRETGRFLHTL